MFVSISEQPFRSLRLETCGKRSFVESHVFPADCRRRRTHDQADSVQWNGYTEGFRINTIFFAIRPSTGRHTIEFPYERGGIEVKVCPALSAKRSAILHCSRKPGFLLPSNPTHSRLSWRPTINTDRPKNSRLSAILSHSEVDLA